MRLNSVYLCFEGVEELSIALKVLKCKSYKECKGILAAVFFFCWWKDWLTGLFCSYSEYGKKVGATILPTKRTHSVVG